MALASGYARSTPGLYHCSHTRHCEILSHLIRTRDGSLRSPNKSQVD